MNIKGGIKMSYYINNKESFLDMFSYHISSSSCIQESLYNKDIESYIYHLRIINILNESKSISNSLKNKIKENISMIQDRENSIELEEVLLLYEGLEEWCDNNLENAYVHVQSVLKKKLLDNESFSQLELSIKTVDKRTKRLFNKQVSCSSLERMINWIQEIPYLISKGLFLDEIKNLSCSYDLTSKYLKYTYQEEKDKYMLEECGISEGEETAIAA